jgi:hypothetical protein
MRRAWAGFRPAVLMAAMVATGFGSDLAGAREFRLPVSDGLPLLPGASLSLVVSSNPASGLHVARSECRRWSAAAATLGETYAGHLLRQTVVRRRCRYLEADGADEAWDWPWTSLREGRVLPPRLHAAQGEWEIRCGHAGGRRRCALLNRSHAPLHEGLDPKDHGIITHFVVDTVGGREALLWRLFVPTPPAVTAVASTQIEADATPRTAGPGGGEVRYRLEDAERAELFPACAAAGCLMEAGLRRAGDVATRLWEGRSIDVRISLATGAALTLTLPAAGFRAGLKELVRLRREESRPGVKD